MCNKHTKKLIKNKDSIDLINMLMVYSDEFKREAILVDIHKIVLADYEFNYCFNNDNLKNSFRFINLMKSSKKKDWLLKLIYFLDDVK